MVGVVFSDFVGPLVQNVVLGRSLGCCEFRKYEANRVRRGFPTEWEGLNTTHRRCNAVLYFGNRANLQHRGPPGQCCENRALTTRVLSGALCSPATFNKGPSASCPVPSHRKSRRFWLPEPSVPLRQQCSVKETRTIGKMPALAACLVFRLLSPHSIMIAARLHRFSQTAACASKPHKAQHSLQD